MTVSIAPLDPALIEALLLVAVNDATPDEVIPPVEGPPGWIPARQDFFRAFHTERLGGLDAAPLHTQMYAILADAGIVGMIRLSRVDPPGAMETGMWLGRSARGRGIAPRAVRLVMAAAAEAGGSSIRAETTVGNLPAQATLRRAGATLTPAPDTLHVTATLPTA